MCTHDGCPLLYPLSRHEFGLLPEPVRITTNKLAEHWVVSPLLLAGLAYFLWRDAGFSLAATNHLAGRLSRRHHPPPGAAVSHAGINYCSPDGGLDERGGHIVAAVRIYLLDDENRDVSLVGFRAVDVAVTGLTSFTPSVLISSAQPAAVAAPWRLPVHDAMKLESLYIWS